MLIVLQNKYPMSKQEEDSILLRLEQQIDLGHLLLIPECLYVQDIIMGQDDNSTKVEIDKTQKTITVGEFLLSMTEKPKCRRLVRVRKRLEEGKYRNLLSITVSNYVKTNNFDEYLQMIKFYEKQITGQEIATLSILWDFIIKYKDEMYDNDLSQYEYNIVV